MARVVRIDSFKMCGVGKCGVKGVVMTKKKLAETIEIAASNELVCRRGLWALLGVFSAAKSADPHSLESNDDHPTFWRAMYEIAHAGIACR